MSTVTRTTTASVERVWEVLADGWSYPLWVVGASRMRAVSATWPQPGAKLHHSAGTWPALLDDETEVLECEPQRRLRLQAKGRPFGTAAVEITLAPVAAGTAITIAEDVATGPSKVVPKPVRQAAIVARNKETLRRLALVAEARTQP